MQKTYGGDTAVYNIQYPSVPQDVSYNVSIMQYPKPNDANLKTYASSCKNDWNRSGFSGFHFLNDLSWQETDGDLFQDGSLFVQMNNSRRNTLRTGEKMQTKDNKLLQLKLKSELNVSPWQG